ncbi:polymer-forming cytoskeletal protein [Hyphobacterium sp. HN65]|uniref:Polymer-forming cytoskeletal protein n=1 Tax=Hyphobacterium lacteum TaxID=3116575 RepID=A0ABU7LLL3_9PROT|nr:polymer-forming cytoskeletal protein [Hyphobacterium sp. HN65]MEE2524820.1 polymer-forming cytoskeletal protein [Hyphobacterium sp. HN65]
MKSKAPSIISADMVLQGSITSEGEVQLDGTVEGDVRAGSLTIGEDAAVDGQVVAESVIVRGRVKGSIKARQVQLASTARIEGDIVHSALSMESGAFFDGHCRHSSDPVADAGSAKKAAPAPNSSAPSGGSSSSKPSNDMSSGASSSSTSGSSTSPSLDLPKAKSSA